MAFTSTKKSLVISGATDGATQSALNAALALINPQKIIDVKFSCTSILNVTPANLFNCLVIYEEETV